jgi:hypothetical protein
LGKIWNCENIKPLAYKRTDAIVAARLAAEIQFRPQMCRPSVDVPKLIGFVLGDPVQRESSIEELCRAERILPPREFAMAADRHWTL